MSLPFVKIFALTGNLVTFYRAFHSFLSSHFANYLLLYSLGNILPSLRKDFDLILLEVSNLWLLALALSFARVKFSFT